jgi:hypothetical protein
VSVRFTRLYLFKRFQRIVSERARQSVESKSAGMLKACARSFTAAAGHDGAVVLQGDAATIFFEL